MFVSYLDAHAPYIPPAPFDRQFPGMNESFDSPRWRQSVMNDVHLLKRSMAAEERAHMVSQYDGEIAYLDDRFGKLVARLKQWGIYDNTVIVITSDHGEAFGERNLVGHAVSVYQTRFMCR